MMRYHIDELKHLLKKKLAGTLTAEESLFLNMMRPLFEEKGWNEWLIEAALAQPEPEDPVAEAATEQQLLKAFARAEAKAVAPRGHRQRFINHKKEK